MRDIDPEQAKNEECILHALKVRTAMADSNYCAFFRLYQDAPNMGARLMDVCVERIRTAAVSIMLKVCPATRPVRAARAHNGLIRRLWCRLSSRRSQQPSWRNSWGLGAWRIVLASSQSLRRRK